MRKKTKLPRILINHDFQRDIKRYNFLAHQLASKKDNGCA